MTPQLKHIQLAAGVMLAAFVLSCRDATGPNVRTVAGDCSAEIAAEKAGNPVAPYITSGPDWIKLAWVDHETTYTRIGAQCRIETVNLR